MSIDDGNDREAEGRAAFAAGLGLDANPHGFRDGRAKWSIGWFAARGDAFRDWKAKNDRSDNITGSIKPYDPQTVIACAIASVCGDGNSNAMLVARDVIGALYGRGVPDHGGRGNERCSNLIRPIPPKSRSRRWSTCGGYGVPRRRVSGRQ